MPPKMLTATPLRTLLLKVKQAAAGFRPALLYGFVYQAKSKTKPQVWGFMKPILLLSPRIIKTSNFSETSRIIKVADDVPFFCWPNRPISSVRGQGMHLSSPSNAFAMAWKILWAAQPEEKLSRGVFFVFRCGFTYRNQCSTQNRFILYRSLKIKPQ